MAEDMVLKISMAASINQLDFNNTSKKYKINNGKRDSYKLLRMERFEDWKDNENIQLTYKELTF